MVKVKIHAAEDFQKMRDAGKLAAMVLDFITPYVKPGCTTNQLDVLCHAMILDHHAIPATLGYRGYAKSICTSLNNVVCHGIPSDRVLQEGDILNIDVTVILDGWHGDTSRMYQVGDPKKWEKDVNRIRARRLCDVTYQTMMMGIEQIKPGNTLGDIGHAMQTYAERCRFSIVREYTGHGIGRVFHDQPNVLNYGTPKKGLVLQEGMFFTVEPMLNAGKAGTTLNQKDGWTVTTRDHSLSAQFEHTVGVARDGYEIFTLSPKGYHKPPY